MKRSLLAALFVLALARPSAALAPPRARLEVLLPLSETSWLGAGALGSRSYRLSAEPWRGLLERYLEPFRNHTPEWRSLFRGAYGPSQRNLFPELCWSRANCVGDPPESARVSPGFSLELAQEWPPLPAAWAALSLGLVLVAPEPEKLAVTVKRGCAPWQAPRVVTFLRAPRESDRFALLDCDGSISSEALDRLSVLARPTGSVRPELPLPLEAQVRLLHPRLLWAVSRIAESFPRHAIEIVSGYRPGHGGLHAKGRALDLAVVGAPKEAVFQACRKLRDAGCGYYPESRFIHLDVRGYGVGHVAWVDESRPGEPSRYVDSFPGVLTARAGQQRPTPAP